MKLLKWPLKRLRGGLHSWRPPRPARDATCHTCPDGPRLYSTVHEWDSLVQSGWWEAPSQFPSEAGGWWGRDRGSPGRLLAAVGLVPLFQVSWICRTSLSWTAVMLGLGPAQPPLQCQPLARRMWAPVVALMSEEVSGQHFGVRLLSGLHLTSDLLSPGWAQEGLRDHPGPRACESP